MGEILLGLRCLVTRAHNMTPFSVLYGFEADLPHFLRITEHDIGNFSELDNAQM